MKRTTFYTCAVVQHNSMGTTTRTLYLALQKYQETLVQGIHHSGKDKLVFLGRPHLRDRQNK